MAGRAFGASFTASVLALPQAPDIKTTEMANACMGLLLNLALAQSMAACGKPHAQHHALRRSLISRRPSTADSLAMFIGRATSFALQLLCGLCRMSCFREARVLT
jgi:hypothetical protein